MSLNYSLPKISIAIPTRSREGYLRIAVESALAQTYPNLEIVVSDNASDDGTWKYLSSLTDSRLIVCRQTEDLGMVGNFNACLSAASGELFLMLSDDDLVSPDAAEKLSAPFRAPDAARIGLSWCPCRLIDADGKQLWTTEAGPVRELPVDLLLGLFDGRRGTRFSAIMVRHADAVHFGGYDQARHGVLCDTGNWGRIALLYDAVCCIQEPLVQYRVHAASLTQVANCGDWQRYGDNMHEDFLAVLNKSGGMKEAKRLARGFSNHLANITVTVLLRFIRKPGWVSLYVREFWRSRRFMITLFVARRMLRDGWKLLRI